LSSPGYRVLELGSGLGLGTIATVLAGASDVTATDTAEVLPRLHANCAANLSTSLPAALTVALKTCTEPLSTTSDDVEDVSNGGSFLGSACINPKVASKDAFAVGVVQLLDAECWMDVQCDVVFHVLT
jgi:predicted nicotinamide N-methyase